MTLQQRKTWVAKCPICINGKLVDIAKEVSPSKVNLYPPNSCKDAEYFVKCHKCKSQIGIKINK